MGKTTPSKLEKVDSSDGEVELVGEWRIPMEGREAAATSTPLLTRDLTDVQQLRRVRLKRKLVGSPGSPQRIQTSAPTAERDPLALDASDACAGHMKLRAVKVTSYQCDACRKTIANRRNFIDHFRRLHEAKRFACPRCAKMFSRVGFLRQHVAEHEQPFVCQYCRKAFKRRSYLNRHVKNMHERVESPCATCARVFSCEAYLKKHVLRLHTFKVM